MPAVPSANDIFHTLHARYPTRAMSSLVVMASGVRALLMRECPIDVTLDALIVEHGFAPNTALMYHRGWRLYNETEPAPGAPMAAPTPGPRVYAGRAGASAIPAFLLYGIGNPTPTAVQQWRARCQSGQITATDSDSREAVRKAFVPPEVGLILRNKIAKSPLDVATLAWSDVIHRPHPFDPNHPGTYQVYGTAPRGQPRPDAKINLSAEEHDALRFWASPMNPDYPLVPVISGSSVPMSMDEIAWFARRAKKA